MVARRRFPGEVHKLVGRKWEHDADRLVQDKLQELQDVSQGLPKLPITDAGDILIFSDVYDRLSAGEDGQVLSSNSEVASGLEWIDIGNSDQSILAAMIFGQ